MDTFSNQHSDSGSASNKAAVSYNLNQAIDTCQQRIKNLEQFRDLFFDLQDQVSTGRVSAKILSSKGNLKGGSEESGQSNQLVSDRLNQLRNLSADQAETIDNLKTALKGLEIQDEEYRRILEDQLVEISKMGRQFEESKSCAEMIELELERLIDENEILRNQLKEQELTTDSALASSDNLENNSESITEPGAELDKAKLRITSLEQEVEQASDLAFGSMRSNADLGAVVHFLMECFSCNELEELAKQIFVTLKNYGVEGILEIRHEGTLIHFGPNGEGDVDTSAIGLLEAHLNDGRLVELEKYLIVNGDQSSLILKNYDKSNLAAYNNLKDNLTMIVMGADANSKRIFTEMAVERERSTLEKLILATRKALQKVESDLQNQSLEVQNNISDLLADFRDEVAKQSVPNEQKNILLKAVVNGISKVETVMKGVKIDPGFKHIIKTLSDSVGAQRKAANKNTKK
ncbi:MAG: hypothetical protein JKY67_13480 [Pseudomonadales bacterium]|nr:hypothetical protein [Pseudomonadales bacterium]